MQRQGPRSLLNVNIQGLCCLVSPEISSSRFPTWGWISKRVLWRAAACFRDHPAACFPSLLRHKTVDFFESGLQLRFAMTWLDSCFCFCCGGELIRPRRVFRMAGRMRMSKGVSCATSAYSGDLMRKIKTYITKVVEKDEPRCLEGGENVAYLWLRILKNASALHILLFFCQERTWFSMLAVGRYYKE